MRRLFHETPLLTVFWLTIGKILTAGSHSKSGGGSPRWCMPTTSRCPEIVLIQTGEPLVPRPYNKELWRYLPHEIDVWVACQSYRRPESRRSAGELIR